MIKHIMLMVALAVASPAYAGNGNNNGNSNGEQGSSNGQPFKTLQQQIDELRADVENQIACINDYLNNTANAEDPSACEDYSNSIIEELEVEVAELAAQLAALEGLVQNAECPAGFSIRDLDPLICERDDDTNDRLFSRIAFGNTARVPPRRTGISRATCPSGYVAVGCGYDKSSSIDILSQRVVGNYCYLRGHNETTFSTRAFRALAHCAIAAPRP